MALALSLTTASAAAQDAEEPMKTAAKALYNEARDARKSDDFATCYAKATAALSIHKHPSIAALVGDCGVGAGKYRDGAEKLSFFFDSGETIGSPELIAHLKSRLEEAKKHVATVTVSVSVPDATCEVDGVRLDKVPSTVFLDAGSHAFEARHPKHVTDTRQVDLTAGTTLSIQLELAPLPEAPPPPPPPSEPTMTYLIGAGVSGVVAVGGMALMIASAVLHGEATDTIDRLDAEIDALGGNSSCNNGGGSLAAQCTELSGAIDDQSTFSTLFPVGIVIAGVGAAAAGTFLVLHFTGAAESETSVRVSPTGITVGGRF